MARSRITVMNMALAGSGQASKQITEGSTGPEFTLMDRFYDEIVGSAMEQENLYFGKTRSQVTNRTTGSFGFDDRWTLPGDVLHIIEVRVNDYMTEDWEREEQYLHIDATSGIEIEYARIGAEVEWSPTFTLGIAGKLEALLRKSINEEFEEAVNTDDQAGDILARAGIHSSKQRGPRRPFRRGFLMNSRLSGRQRFRNRGQK